jgi:ABC-type multidrug transport system fused ATPase/permease subunit
MSDKPVNPIVEQPVNIKPFINILYMIQMSLFILSFIIFVLYLIFIIFFECIGIGIFHNFKNYREEFLKDNEHTFIFDNLIKYNATKYVKLNEYNNWSIEPFYAYQSQYLLNISTMFFLSALVMFVFILIIYGFMLGYITFIMKEDIDKEILWTLYTMPLASVIILFGFYLCMCKALYNSFEANVYSPGKKIYQDHINKADTEIRNLSEKGKNAIMKIATNGHKHILSDGSEKLELFQKYVYDNYKDNSVIIPNFMDFCNINIIPSDLIDEYLNDPDTDYTKFNKNMISFNIIGNYCTSTRDKLQNNMPISNYFFITFIVLLIIIIIPLKIGYSKLKEAIPQIYKNLRESVSS